jgi:myo-inositol-1(or 4)-monophosphatase
VTAQDAVSRIQSALASASELAATFSPRTVGVARKRDGDPVTEADHALDALLHKELVRDGEGWLSEETVDDGHRLGLTSVWIVDPIDGTREFLAGRPEWAVSVALAEDGEAVAAGVLNPWAGQTFLGAKDGGVALNGEPVRVTDPATLDRVRILASRSELRWGQWDRFRASIPFTLIPVGSIAYKMALVAAGLADATVSLEPKNEWDVAAGALLVEAAGGRVTDLVGRPIRFNQRDTLVHGVIAAGPNTAQRLQGLIHATVRRIRTGLWTP